MCLVRIVRLADADVLEQLVEQLVDALGRQVLLDSLALCFRHRRANRPMRDVLCKESPRSRAGASAFG